MQCFSSEHSRAQTHAAVLLHAPAASGPVLELIAMRYSCFWSPALFAAYAFAAALAASHAVGKPQTCGRHSDVVNIKLTLDSLEAEFACPDSSDVLEPSSLTQVLEEDCSDVRDLFPLLPDAKLQQEGSGYKLTVSRVPDLNRRLCYRCKSKKSASTDCTVLIDVPGLMKCTMDTATLEVRSGESVSFQCGSSLLFRPSNESEAFTTVDGRCNPVSSSLSQLVPGSTLKAAGDVRTLTVPVSWSTERELCFQCLDADTQRSTCTVLVHISPAREYSPRIGAAKPAQFHLLWFVGLSVLYACSVHYAWF